jgi:hypothetical protein
LRPPSAPLDRGRSATACWPRPWVTRIRQIDDDGLTLPPWISAGGNPADGPAITPHIGWHLSPFVKYSAVNSLALPPA